MADGESFSFTSLSKMKVSELREICKKEQLLISGNKADLIFRILESISSSPNNEEFFLDEEYVESAEVATSVVETKGKVRSSREIDDAINRLISRVDDKDSLIVDPEPEEPISNDEIMDAEIFDAEIIEEVHEPIDEVSNNDVEPSLILDEKDPWSDDVMDEKTVESMSSTESSEQPSFTITIPSADIFKKYWQQISAVFVVILLVGAGVVYLLSADSSFQARPLNYGDSMTFTLSNGEIILDGDEMVSILRNQLPETAIQDACNRLTVGIAGTGSIAIIEGDDSQVTHPIDRQSSNPDFYGTIDAKDAYGRSHLTVQQQITHDLNVDLEGKTWKDTNVCGNLGWSLSGNDLSMTTNIYDELSESSLLRSESIITISDVEADPTKANIVT